MLIWLLLGSERTRAYIVPSPWGRVFVVPDLTHTCIIPVGWITSLELFLIEGRVWCVIGIFVIAVFVWWGWIIITSPNLFVCLRVLAMAASVSA